MRLPRSSREAHPATVERPVGIPVFVPGDVRGHEIRTVRVVDLTGSVLGAIRAAHNAALGP